MVNQRELGFVSIVLLNLTNLLYKLDLAALDASEARKTNLAPQVTWEVEFS